jgi:hypothetical protein
MTVALHVTSAVTETSSVTNKWIFRLLEFPDSSYTDAPCITRKLDLRV